MALRTYGTEPLWNLAGLGVLMQFAGGFGLGLASAGNDDPPMALVLATWVVIGLGSALLLVSLVGFGVLLGMRARSREA